MFSLPVLRSVLCHQMLFQGVQVDMWKCHNPPTEESELTSAVLVAEVREPPHVPKANDLSRHSQQELNFVGPLSSAIGAGRWVAFHHLQVELGLWTKMGIHFSATTTSKQIKKSNIK